MKYKIQVNMKQYCKAMKFYSYPEFESEKNPTDKYRAGDVVRINTGNECYSIGVILGYINPETEEARTDMEGMVCWSQIQHATINDFSKCVVSPRLIKYLGIKK